MTDIRSLEQMLLDNLPWNKACIKFVARFPLTFYARRTVNLSSLATAFELQENFARLRRKKSNCSGTTFHIYNRAYERL